MTKLKLANKVRAYTKQSGITDANLLLLLNPAKDEIAQKIAERDPKGNYFVVPATDNLVANQREYAQPDDVLDHIFSLELAFSSASPMPYVLAKHGDYSKLGLSRTEANITANYDNLNPQYEIQRRAIYLLSATVPSVTNGFLLRYRAFPADLSGALTDDTTDLSIDPSTTTFGIPRQFHDLWARRASIQWKSEHPGAVPLTVLEKQYPQDLEAALSAIFDNDLSQETVASIPYDDGSDY